jgi:hypothetical protein
VTPILSGPCRSSSSGRRRRRIHRPGSRSSWAGCGMVHRQQLHGGRSTCRSSPSLYERRVRSHVLCSSIHVECNTLWPKNKKTRISPNFEIRAIMNSAQISSEQNARNPRNSLAQAHPQIWKPICGHTCPKRLEATPSLLLKNYKTQMEEESIYRENPFMHTGGSEPMHTWNLPNHESESKLGFLWWVEGGREGGR